MAEWKRPDHLQLDIGLIQDNEPVLILPKIWMGSLRAAYNLDALQKRNITHVLNISGEMDAQWSENFKYLFIDLRDKANSNILSCIPASNLFIEAGVKSGGIFVHCRGGKSRSPALVIAYLMASLRWSFKKSHTHMMERRPAIEINAGFKQQLIAYQQCREIYMAQQMILRRRIYNMATSHCTVSESPRLNSEWVVSKKKKKKVAKPPRICVMRPKSPRRRYVPPLRGMDVEFVCRNCRESLFFSSSILRHDVAATKASKRLDATTPDQSFLNIWGDTTLNTDGSECLPEVRTTRPPPTRRNRDRGTKGRKFKKLFDMPPLAAPLAPSSRPSSSDKFTLLKDEKFAMPKTSRKSSPISDALLGAPAHVAVNGPGPREFGLGLSLSSLRVGTAPTSSPSMSSIDSSTSLDPSSTPAPATLAVKTVKRRIPGSPLSPIMARHQPRPHKIKVPRRRTSFTPGTTSRPAGPRRRSTTASLALETGTGLGTGLSLNTGLSLTINSARSSGDLGFGTDLRGLTLNTNTNTEAKESKFADLSVAASAPRSKDNLRGLTLNTNTEAKESKFADLSVAPSADHNPSGDQPVASSKAKVASPLRRSISAPDTPSPKSSLTNGISLKMHLEARKDNDHNPSGDRAVAASKGPSPLRLSIGTHDTPSPVRQSISTHGTPGSSASPVRQSISTHDTPGPSGPSGPSPLRLSISTRGPPSPKAAGDASSVGARVSRPKLRNRKRLSTFPAPQRSPVRKSKKTELSDSDTPGRSPRWLASSSSSMDSDARPATSPCKSTKPNKPTADGPFRRTRASSEGDNEILVPTLRLGVMQAAAKISKDDSAVSPSSSEPLLYSPGRPRSGDQRMWVLRMSGALEAVSEKASLGVSQMASTDLEAAVFACDILAVEPLPWMGDNSADQGTIHCPNHHCGVPLGFWNWSGTRCKTCGVHVKPAFFIHKSAVLTRERISFEKRKKKRR